MANDSEVQLKAGIEALDALDLGVVAPTRNPDGTHE